MHGSNHREEMVCPGTTSSYKLSGTVSRSICPQSIYKEKGSNAGSTANGQHISSTLHQKNGRDQVPNSSLASKKSLGMVSRTSDCARSSAYPGNSKYRSRQTVPDLCGQQRLETCTPSIRQSKSGLEPLISQCMGPRLEQIPRLRIPTVLIGGMLLKTSANTQSVPTLVLIAPMWRTQP